MTNLVETLTASHLVRKTRAQKTAFSAWLSDELSSMGYKVKSEKGGIATNIIVGDPETAEILLSAHYDTPAVLFVPNFLSPGNLPLFIFYQFVLSALIIAAGALAAWLVSFFAGFMWSVTAFYLVMLLLLLSMMIGPANKRTYNDNTSGVATLLSIAAALPKESRDKVCFLFFDFEELGMIGARAFAKRHPDAAEKLLFNFDCVGDGNHMLFILPRKIRVDSAFVEKLSSFFPLTDDLRFSVPKGLMIFPSDQVCFPRGAAVAAFHRLPMVGYYVGRIHTPRDTVMIARNIDILTDIMISYVVRHGN